ncbi:hypothetical protein MAM1_0881c11332 [Mucor ambiguus]|uniref:CCHC-type domain-containing protein n=1 Tax=Mucor ambiguus TaxID=91626 RepID=A0A0C9MLT1_9FUNG|nr:hypothetical protein MAM1_0881c11332 [Mucor ambiguus]
MSRVTNLDEGIRVATDIERSLANKQVDTYMGPIKPELNHAKEEYAPAQQNYQHKQGNKKKFDRRSDNKMNKRKETRECYKCHKVGHISKDCWSTKKAQNAQQVKREEEENVFAHLTINNSQAEESFNTGSRFKVEVQMKEEQFMRKVLVDTGSTISSIKQSVAEELGLETIPTPRVYDSICKAYVYVVEKQNEDIILGMDWLQKEDIVIQTKNKKISRGQGVVERNNSTATVVDKLLEQYPNLTSEDTTQSRTTAPYKHSINTGDAKPVVTRDFRRSPAENAAIAEEVKVMLVKGVIVPSQSDWCSPVILIKKPDGTFRFCVDYRNLNKVVIKDEFPLPLIPDLLEKLRGYKYFSSYCAP